VDVTGKLALGTTDQTATINGETRFNGMPPVAGGFLALPGANIGRFSREMFTIVPELGLTLHYQLTDCVRVFVGYNVLCWSNVARAGDQVDLRVNTNRVPSLQGTTTAVTPGPMHTFTGTGFYAQGVNLGLEIRY
jgi:hypothetical protein